MNNFFFTDDGYKWVENPTKMLDIQGVITIGDATLPRTIDEEIKRLDQLSIYTTGDATLDEVRFRLYKTVITLMITQIKRRHC